VISRFATHRGSIQGRESWTHLELGKFIKRKSLKGGSKGYMSTTGRPYLPSNLKGKGQPQVRA